MAMMWEDFVGIPFKDKGRDFDGADCWGLFRLVYLHALDINLPLYMGGYNGRADKHGVAGLIEDGKRAWDEVESGKEQTYDAILMKIHGFQHLGLVVESGLMLHMPRDSYSTMERYDTMRYQNVVEGFYKYVIPYYDDLPEAS